MVPRKQLVLFGIVTTLAVAQTAVQAAPVLSIDVAPPITAGGVVEAKVNIAGVADLYAFQFDLAFDPAVIGAVGVTEGPFLPSAGGTLFDAGTIDNLAGKISFIASTLTGPAPGASGGGTLATITFNGLGLGTSVLSLSNVILLDSALGDIDATATGGVVRVVPEPGTLLLTSAGLAAMVSRRNRHRRRVQ